MPRSVDSLKAFVAGGGTQAFRLRKGVVVLGSGKGGTGTSLLSALLALGASRSGASVLLVDGDETAGTLHLLFGLPSGLPGVGALRSEGVTPRQLLVDVAPRVALLPGGGGDVEATFAVAPAERRALLRRVGELYDEYDLVVVDGGSRLDSVMAACAAGVERLVCVTTSDRIALASTYALVKVAQARFPGMPMELLVNGEDQEAARATHAMVQSASSAFLGSAVDFGGSVPDDPVARRGMGEGSLIQSLPHDSPLVDASAHIAHRLVTAALHAAGPPATVLPLHP